jgi:hypothetical protein
MILERFVRDIDLDGTLDSIGDSINSGWFTKLLNITSKMRMPSLWTI